MIEPQGNSGDDAVRRGAGADGWKPLPISRVRSAAGPPAGLPSDPSAFWSPAVDLEPLDKTEVADATPALKRLGPLPLAHGGFPLIGFLATVYEQIAGHAVEALAAASPRRQEAEPPPGQDSTNAD